MVDVNKIREKKMRATGRWFDSSKSESNDQYLIYILPLILIISLCATVYVAIN